MSFEIEIKKNAFSENAFYIDEEKVSYHDMEMNIDEVVGVTWYIEEMPVPATYLVKPKYFHFRIMDEAGDEIKIDFTNTANFRANDIYNSIVENLRRFIGAKLFETIYEKLLEGISTDLDRC